MAAQDRKTRQCRKITVVNRTTNSRVYAAVADSFSIAFINQSISHFNSGKKARKKNTKLTTNAHADTFVNYTHVLKCSTDETEIQDKLVPHAALLSVATGALLRVLKHVRRSLLKQNSIKTRLKVHVTLSYRRYTENSLITLMHLRRRQEGQLPKN